MANNNTKCGCDFNIKTVGNCDISKLNLNGKDRANLNWTEISVPEILNIPELKPDIEGIDQVYANVILDNVKLIETPFAYKKYTLYSLYEEIIGLPDLLEVGPLITAVDAVLAVLSNPDDPLTPGVVQLLEGLLSSLAPYSNVPVISALITSLENIITDVGTLVKDITSALDAVIAAVLNLVAAINSEPNNVDLICSLIQVVIDTLNTLKTIIESVVGIVEGLLDTLTAVLDVVAAIPVVGPIVAGLIQGVIDGVQLLLDSLTNTLVAAVTNLIDGLLTTLVNVNCTNSCIFKLIGNAEGTCLTGRKLIIEGTLKQKIVYTAEVDVQSVHSANYEVPFIAFIIPYAKFEGATYQENIEVYDPVTDGPIVINGYNYDCELGINVDLCEEFNIEKCIEDIYVYALDKRRIFKNITVFLKAKPGASCN